MLPLLFRQIWTLAWKDILLVLNRDRSFTTVLRAFTAPLIFSIYLAFILRVYWPKETYGIGTPTTVRMINESLPDTTGGRNKIGFVNSGLSGGAIDSVIQTVGAQYEAEGKAVSYFSNEDDLIALCPMTLQGTSHCLGAAVFYSSPDEGPGRLWNYTIRADGSFGGQIDVKKSDNDVEIYLLPFQHAIDAAISQNNTNPLPSNVQEYPYTSMTEQEWKDKITTDLQNANTNFLSIVWYLAFIGVLYQLVGLMANERETGMASLIESMMPNLQRWQPLWARLLGHHLAFTLVWGPSWIVISIIQKIGLYKESSIGILLIFNILAGLSLISYSLFSASFFRKAQLSGITSVIIALIIGVLAQVLAKDMSSATIAILSFLFPPMAYVFFMIWISQYEHMQVAANLVKGAPKNEWGLPGIVIWIALIFHIFLFPLLAAWVEQALYGSGGSDSKRTVTIGDGNSENPVELTNFTKHYYPGWFMRTFAGGKKHPVRAVTDMSLRAVKGQIMVLVGANGCGKSTTLNAIAGIGDITSGTLALDGTGGIGICPQKNVLWDLLTVRQHADIFNRLKRTSTTHELHENLEDLIAQCGLTAKTKSPVKTLSGGQKRKLQLIMMLTGGSRVCCVDEVSGGLDAISRRKIWDILLAERGRRTVLLTTHFLDEAEFLADHMVIMSKGILQAEGSVSELKAKLGGGYRIHVLRGTGYGDSPQVDHLFADIEREPEVLFDQTIYTVPDSARAMQAIKQLGQAGVKDYQVTGPTIEEVFMKLAAHPGEAGIIHSDTTSETAVPAGKAKSNEKPSVTVHEDLPADTDALLSGARLGFIRQSFILFRKRMTILRRNWVPYAAALLIPIAAAAIFILLVGDYNYPGCSRRDSVSISDVEKFANDIKPLMVVGPSSELLSQNLSVLTTGLSSTVFGNDNTNTSLADFVHFVDTLDAFNSYIDTNFANVTPGGFFLPANGTPATFAYLSDIGITSAYSSIFVQNLLDRVLVDTAIVTNYKVFDWPWPSDTGNALQFLFYFGLVFAAYPAFFGLYPTVERIRNIRALEYSNGVRSLPLWLAYLAFDWCLVLIISAIVTIIFAAAAPDAWWFIGYFFVVLCLYGLASILLSYAISLFAKSQLAAFAFAAGYQALMLLLYMTAVMNVEAQSPPEDIDRNILLTHFTIGIITPAGQLARSILVGLNIFSMLCSGSPPVMATYPGDITLFGGPILYLIGQSLFLFGLLLYKDSDFKIGLFKKQAPSHDVEDNETMEKEVSEEVARVRNSDDGLRVMHLTKTFKSKAFGKITAVDDLTFGVKKGEVFALVGPNGAGKSTTISMLRGEIAPSRSGGTIALANADLFKERKTARAHLGVCPQFDAVDQMTAFEHLRFYAGIRGVAEAEHNARQIIKAVGLEAYSDRMASKLSGGNKRKLSLGIALIGNPEVVLLDEPSTGCDPLTKRTMWKTLTKFVPGRSVLLTTHSMEEADHLASRVGIIAKHMLDVGTTSHLRQKHGYGFHIHVIHYQAPNTSPADMEGTINGIKELIPGVEVEGFPYNGQCRLNVRAHRPEGEVGEKEGVQRETNLEELFLLLEENKKALGLEYYSVSPSTFDEVFLRVVEKHNVGEEDSPQARRNWKTKAVGILWLIIWPWGGRRH